MIFMILLSPYGNNDIYHSDKRSDNIKLIRFLKFTIQLGHGVTAMSSSILAKLIPNFVELGPACFNLIC